MLRIFGMLMVLGMGVLVRGEVFFAMNTGISGTDEEVAEALWAEGYDGYGSSGMGGSSGRGALEKKGLRLWNVYLTLSFAPGGVAVTPEMKRLLDGLEGSGSCLWIAVQKVEGGDGVALPALREIAVAAKAKGVTVALYPHAGFYLERFADAVRLAEGVEYPRVGVTFNLCHWLKVEGDVDPVPALKEQRGRLQFVTVNGADGGDTKGMGWDRLIQPLGEGTYAVGDFLRRLRTEVEWRGAVGLQAYGVKGDQRGNLRKSMAAWRKMNDLLDGRVWTGYQGWFRCEGDGGNIGWHHYGVNGKFEPGHLHIDVWPDVSELGDEERFKTPFRHADGRVAEVFSSMNGATVRRHFRWMREYGIDGAMVQRFAAPARDGRFRASMDVVLRHCRESAAAEGRKWALMYDLSGLAPEDFPSVEEDWKRMLDEKVIAFEDGAWLRPHHRPLVALWGVGLNDRAPGLAEWERLIRFFKEEGCAVMLGVPDGWRELNRDSIGDVRLHALIAMADVVSPWAVGRFGTPEDAAGRVGTRLVPDVEWCGERGLGYLPVVFPGFSWQNLEKSRGREAKLDAIPRLGGRFLWSQLVAAKRAGARSVYVAMFDEQDEATAIFKVTQDPPVGASRFVAEPGVAGDQYLWLSGQGGRLLRGEIPVTDEMPDR